MDRDSSQSIGQLCIPISLGLTSGAPRAHVCFANRGVALSRSKGTSRDEARWFNLDTRTGGQPESEGGGGGGGVSEETGQRQVMLQLCFRSVPSPMA